MLTDLSRNLMLLYLESCHLTQMSGYRFLELVHMQS